MMNNQPEIYSTNQSSRRRGVLSPAFSDCPVRSLAGLTLVELLIAMGIVAILATLGYTMYSGQIKAARLNVTIQDIKSISQKVIEYHADTGEYPASLADTGTDTWKDPWDNPYKYLKIKGVIGLGGMRKDRFLVPLNSDFDLYSMGPDGQSKPPLTAAVSKDDIIRANDGQFVGPAHAY